MPTCMNYFLGFVALTSSYKEALPLSHILRCLAQTCVSMCKRGMPVSVCVHTCTPACVSTEKNENLKNLGVCRVKSYKT